MHSLLRYGADSQVQFDLPQEAVLANCQAPRGTPLGDVETAVAAALAEPVGFPPLTRAVVPGDHVVIALEPAVPQAPSIVTAVVRALMGAGVDPEDITVLITADSESGLSDLGSALAASGPVAVRRHDPSDRNRLSYLANIGEGKPVHLNRAICEADFVVPVGCLRLETSFSYQGVCDGVFPTFADAATQGRYRSPAAADSQVQRKRLRKQATEVAWLLGALFTLRVLPGPGDAILGVLAGDASEVDRRGRAMCEAAWSFQVPQRASLVVAAIEGGRSQQTWYNLARAVSAVGDAVAVDGTIAVCCALETAPGPALRQLASADSPEDALREIVRERSSDALVASQLIRALENGRLYLLSRLDDDVVEELGIAPINDAAALARLAARHETCILLANAQHAVVAASDE